MKITLIFLITFICIIFLIYYFLFYNTKNKETKKSFVKRNTNPRKKFKKQSEFLNEPSIFLNQKENFEAFPYDIPNYKLTDDIIHKFNLQSDSDEKYEEIKEFVNSHVHTFKIKYNDNDNNNLTTLLFLIYKDLFLNNNEIISVVDRIKIGEYIIWRSDNNNEINHVYGDIINISQSTEYDNKTRANAVDVLLRSNNSKYIKQANELLALLRRDERIVTDRIVNIDLAEKKEYLEEKLSREELDDIELQFTLNELQQVENQLFDVQANKNKKSLYFNDTQNIHNHEINESVLEASKNLTKDLPQGDISFDALKGDLISIKPEYTNSINKSIDRISTDTSTFRGGILMRDVLRGLYQYINNNPNKKELFSRLAEELNDMNGTCSSGHLGRLVNVIQGFDNVPEEFIIKINPKDEIYSNITNHLNRAIQNSEDSDIYLEAIMDSKDIHNNKPFISFIAEVMNKHIIILREDYVEKLKYDEERLNSDIKNALNEYLKNDRCTEIILKDIL